MEIKRLQITAPVVSKSTLDARQTHDTIQAQQKKLEFLNSQNQELLSEINEIRDLLGLCESKDPTDKDRINLKKLVRQLKQRNETLYDENKQLGDVIEQLKQGRFNETEGARMILDETA